MPTSGNLKTGDSFFCTPPPPNINDQPPPPPRSGEKHRSFNFKIIYNGIKTVSMVTTLGSPSKMQIQNVIHRCILTSLSTFTWNDNVYSFFALLFFYFHENVTVL